MCCAQKQGEQFKASKAIENDERPFRWTMVKGLLGWECLGCIGVYGGLYHLDLAAWIITSLDRNPYEHIRIWGNLNVTTVLDGFLNTDHILGRLNCWTTLFDGRNMVVTKVLKFQSLECISFSCRSPSSPEASNRKDLREHTSLGHCGIDFNGSWAAPPESSVATRLCQPGTPSGKRAEWETRLGSSREIRLK